MKLAAALRADALIVRALSHQADDPEPLLFRTVRARMCVGIARRRAASG